MAKPKAAVIILNWNGLQDTLECLESIKKISQDLLTITTYVIDNASTDNPADKIRKTNPQVKLTVNKLNLGFSGGNNVGILQAIKDGHSQIILLNNDTTIQPDSFSVLAKLAKTNNFDIASPKIYFYPGREFHNQNYKKNELGKIIWYAGGRIDWDNVWPSHIGVDEFDHGQFDQIKKTEFATGCCMLINKSVIEKIGLLDTTYQAYFEDNDFCQRAKKAGFKIGFIPQSTIWHKNAGSTGGSGSLDQKKLIDNSRLTFALRFAPSRAKLALIKQKVFN